MAKRITAPQLIKAQKARFTAAVKSIDDGLEDVRKGAREDLLALTDQKPSGKSRREWLRAAGHPFGRGVNSASSTPVGAKRGLRGVSKERRMKLRAKYGVSSAKGVGSITGGLRRRIISRKVGNKLIVGFGSGQSNWVAVAGGTRKMVDRGLMGPNGEVRSRVKSRLYALRSHFKKANRKP